MKGLAALELDGKHRPTASGGCRDPVRLRRRLSVPNWERLFAVFAALRQGWTRRRGGGASPHIDPWFLREIQEIVELEAELACWDLRSVPAELLRRGQAGGLSDARIAELLAAQGGARARAPARRSACAASTSASTPAPPSSRRRRPTSTRPSATRTRSRPTTGAKVVILGSGPNRIGQGIEFDYCCVHAAFALREARLRDGDDQLQPGDGVDRLRHLRPPLLRAAHPRARARGDRPREAGGRHRAARRADAAQAGARPRRRRRADLGHPPDAIDLAEDRERFGALLAEEGILQPEHGNARTFEEAPTVARRIGFPVMVRPSLRARRPRHGRLPRRDDARAATCATRPRSRPTTRCCSTASSRTPSSSTSTCSPTASDAVVCGILQHIEEAGIHSGDSAAVLPPVAASTRPPSPRCERIALRLAHAARRRRPDERAVRRPPGQGLRARGQPARLAHGALHRQGGGAAARRHGGAGDGGARPSPRWASPRAARCRAVFVKVPVFPFNRFPGVDPQLGPEMKSTGEVMGIGEDFGEAFAKGWIAANHRLPLERHRLPLGARPRQAGAGAGGAAAARSSASGWSRPTARPSTCAARACRSRPCTSCTRGARTSSTTSINGEIDLVVNTPLGRRRLPRGRRDPPRRARRTACPASPRSRARWRRRRGSRRCSAARCRWCRCRGSRQRRRC